MKIINKNLSWPLFFVASFSICVFVFYSSITKIYKYIRLDQKTVVLIDKWQIRNIENKKFFAIANYSFNVEKKKFSNKYAIGNFLNPERVKIFIENSSDKDFEVWYNKKNPKISALDKKFPLKSLIYSIITLGIFLYFIILKTYVVKFHDI